MNTGRKVLFNSLGVNKPMSVADSDGSARACGLTQRAITPSGPSKIGVQMGAGLFEAQHPINEDTTVISATTLQPNAADMDAFKVMLAQGSCDSTLDNDDLEHVPLKKFWKKKSKEKEIVDPLRCHRSAIAKSGIKLGKNKKKSSSSSSFSLLIALSDFDGPLEDLTDHDKEIMREIDPLFEGIT